ncbi:unnamed protein product [Closterium sp. Yama58-4]|nr:unnamed protein product [Closterium sp. Yama58-4]
MAARSSLAMAASSLSNPSGFSGISSSMIVPSPLPRATSALSSSSTRLPELRLSPATCDSRSMISATAGCRISKGSLIVTRFGQSSDQRPSHDGNQPGYPYAFTRVPNEASFSADGSWPDNYKVWENGGGLVHVEAVVDSSAVIEPSAVVHAEARIGAKTRIGSGSVVGPYVKIGAETIVWYNVSLTNCTVGDRCVFHNGVQIGQDGFGFFVDESGNMVKKPQTLGVQIGSDVEMGANTCVDRGSWRDTQIGDFVKIDNLVQIGHNVVIGRCCIICGQTGIGGSSTLGDYVVLAGQVGVADHVTIADKVRVAAKSGVASDIKEPGDYAGFPTVKASEWRRLVFLLWRCRFPLSLVHSALPLPLPLILPLDFALFPLPSSLLSPCPPALPISFRRPAFPLSSNHSARPQSRDSARSTRGGQLSAGDLLGGEERVGAREQRDAAWSACALTGEALREPIAVCQLGRLYNRESVLQLLLWRAGVVAEGSHKWRFTKLQDQLHRFAHIRSTKDIATVRFPSVDHAAHSSRGDNGGNNSGEGEKATIDDGSRCGADTNRTAPAAAAAAAVTAAADALTASAGASSSSRAGGSSATRESGSSAGSSSSSSSSSSSRDASHWVCALSGASACTGLPFSLLRPCGHAFSARALTQVKDRQCPVCGKEYDGSSDVTPINPTPDQVEHLQQQLKVKGRAKRKRVPACDPSRPQSDTQSLSKNKRSCKNN